MRGSDAGFILISAKITYTNYLNLYFNQSKSMREFYRVQSIRNIVMAVKTLSSSDLQEQNKSCKSEISKAILFIAEK